MTSSRRIVPNVAIAAATMAILMTGCGVLPGLPGAHPKPAPPPAATRGPAAAAPATPAQPSATPTPTVTPDDTLSSPMTDPEIATARKLPANPCDVLVSADIKQAGLGTAGTPHARVVQGEHACARKIVPGPTAISVTELPDSRLRQLQQLPVGPASGLTKVAGNTALSGCQYSPDLRVNVCLLIFAMRQDVWALVSWSGKTSLPTMSKTWDRYYPTIGARFPKA